MTLQKLADLGTYEEINGGAHRKAASIVGAPSLVRRIGFWNVGFLSLPAETNELKADKCSDVTPHSKRSGRLDPQKRCEVFNEFRCNLKSVIENDKSGVIHYDSDLIQVSDPQVQSGSLSIFRFWWYGMRTTVRVEYHAEYVTITSILDLSVAEDPRYRPKPGQPNLQHKMRFAFDQLAVLFATPQPENSKLYRGIAFRQNRLWKEFENNVLNAEVGGRRILGASLGQVFADFRGMVTGSSISQRNLKDWFRTPPGSLSRRSLSQTLDSPFRSPLPIKRERAMRHDEPPEAWARDTLARLWPLVEYDDYLRDYEFTVGGFLDGRALYISALGPQPPREEATDWPWAPVFYFLHVYTDDEWQIGRLIDRITTLGTLRLAATMEIGNLFEAGKRVDSLAKEIDRVAGVLQEAIKKAKSGASDASCKAGTATGAAGAQAESWMNSINVADDEMLKIQTELNEIDDTVSGDIAYRLERAHYYMEQFKKEARDLRERRVEGFQKYQEFVMRRMGGVFGYIDLLRTRMDTINAAMSSLGRQYTSLKIASITCSITEQNERMREQHEDMERQEDEIRKIQEFGEIALVGAIVPYYVGASLFHYMLHWEGWAEKLAWLALLTLCAFIVLRRIDSLRRRDDESRTRLEQISKFFWFYLAGIWLLFAISELPGAIAFLRAEMLSPAA